MREAHPEILLDVFSERIDLKRRISLAHRVQKSELDREPNAKPRVNGFAEQCVRLVENQIDGRKCESQIAKTEEQTVYLRHAIKTTNRVFRFAVQITEFIHPLSAPRRGIEKWDHAERPSRGCVQSATHVFGVGQFRLARIVRVEHIIPSFDERTFPPVSDGPVHEECTLIFEFCRDGFVIRTEIAGFIAVKPLLCLPARQVGVNQNVSPGNQ